MNEEKYNLSPDLFADAFPFHFVLTQELRIIQAGKVLQRICPEGLLNSKFEEYFRIIKPRIPLDAYRIEKKSKSFFLLESIHHPFQMKGQMSIDDENGLIFFLGSPWIQDISQITQIGLKLKDFAIHDPIADFLFLFQAQKTSLADAVKNSEDLKEKQEELKSALSAVSEKNISLKKALSDLHEAQDKLIHSEKMVSLGQLISGIAHEINTPLGAIRSSVENISDFLNQSLSGLPEFFQNISPEHQESFLSMLEKFMSNKDYFSSKEKRKIKRNIGRILESENIDNYEVLADTLSDMNTQGEIEKIVPLLKTEDGIEMLNKAYLFSTLHTSTETIKIATTRASKIVFALKKYSRQDLAEEKIKINIVDGLETVLTLYTSQIKQGVELVKNYANIPAIFCYPEELDQVWTNLIHNALQAMDCHGKLVIDVNINDDKIVVEITDSGIGIPEDIMPKIFTPFFTTKPAGEGTGIGLDIVRNIILKHLGNISVESRPGRTKFTVTLPILD